MKNWLQFILVVELSLCIKSDSKDGAWKRVIIWAKCDRAIVHVSISVKENVFIKFQNNRNCNGNKKSILVATKLTRFKKCRTQLGLHNSISQKNYIKGVGVGVPGGVVQRYRLLLPLRRLELGVVR
jgi:hypothetical protein